MACWPSVYRNEPTGKQACPPKLARLTFRFVHSAPAIGCPSPRMMNAKGTPQSTVSTQRRQPTSAVAKKEPPEACGHCPSTWASPVSRASAVLDVCKFIPDENWPQKLEAHQLLKRGPPQHEELQESCGKSFGHAKSDQKVAHGVNVVAYMFAVS